MRHKENDMAQGGSPSVTLATQSQPPQPIRSRTLDNLWFPARCKRLLLKFSLLLHLHVYKDIKAPAHWSFVFPHQIGTSVCNRSFRVAQTNRKKKITVMFAGELPITQTLICSDKQPGCADRLELLHLFWFVLTCTSLSFWKAPRVSHGD